MARDLSAELFGDSKQGARNLASELELTPQAPAPERDYLADIAAAPVTRFFTGAASPFLAAGEAIPGPVGRFFAENTAELRRLQKKGEEQNPNVVPAAAVSGFLGDVMNPVNLTVGRALPAATSGLQLMRQGAATGAAGGLMTPTGTSGEQGAADKLANLGVGTVAGGAVTPVLGKTAQSLGNLLLPAVSTKAAERGAAKTAVKATEGDAARIAETLANTPYHQGMTAAQQVEPLGRLEMAALQNEWAKRMPTEYARNMANQEALRQGLVNTLNARTEPIRQQLMAAGNETTDVLGRMPNVARGLREQAANEVETVRRMVGLEDVAANRAQSLYPMNQMTSQGMTGQPRLPGQYSRAADLGQIAAREGEEAAARSLAAGEAARAVESQIGSYADRGLKPLMAEDYISKVRQALNVPENRPNSTLNLAANKVIRAIQKSANPDGTIPAESLYSLRKTELQNILTTLSKGDPNVAKKMAGGEIANLKGQLDDILEGATGPGWKAYLKDYASRRDAIEEPLRRAERLGEVKNVARDKVLRMLNESQGVQGPPILHRAMTLINAALRGAEGIAGERVNRAGANLMLPQNTQRLGQLMQQQLARPQGLLGDAVRYQGGLYPAAYEGLLDTQ